MRNHPRSPAHTHRLGKPGMTLLELTVVILVLLSLISILFIASRAWKAGADRATCIMHIHNVQKGVRGYSSMYGFSPGDTAPGLLEQVIGYGKFVEATPECNASGIYTYGADFGEDIIPPVGTLYMQCSLASSHDHEPLEHLDW